MNIGAQTVIWGTRIARLPETLRFLAASGCTGVELSQRPDTFGPVEELGKMLDDSGLTLLGLTGGTVLERMRYCGDNLRPQYLYIEEWNKDCPEAIKAGFTLALHPHLYKPVHRLAMADELLEKHPALKFLPDIAHLTIAGDSAVDAVSRWGPRIAAIHLKDWTPISGRSSHRYSRGFVQLGEGSVNFDKVFAQLVKTNYKGWLVFEQGAPGSPPEDVVRHATAWLTAPARGLGRFRPKRTRTGKQPVPPSPSPVSAEPFALEGLPPADERAFLESVFRAAVEDPARCYEKLAVALGRLLQPELVLLCACSPTADLLGIVGVYPTNIRLDQHYINFNESLSSIALERQVVTELDLTSAEPGAPYDRPGLRFGYPQLIKRCNLAKMIAIPAVNPHNPHQTRFVIDIFPSLKTPSLGTEGLTRLCTLVTQAADAALDERCALAAAGANLRAGQCQQAEAFLKELLHLFRESLECAAVTIFLVNDAGNQLDPAATTGISWNVTRELQFYRRNEGLVGSVWESRESVIAWDVSQSYPQEKSAESNSVKSPPSIFCAPMIDATGAVVGVVRCRHKRGEGAAAHMFSEDDVAVFDAICQAAVPHLQVLLSKERRSQALRRLTHELNNPVVAIRGAADAMTSELRRRRGSSENFFSEDYIGDVQGWASLMRMLLDNIDFSRQAERKRILQQARVKLYGDVFMPAANQIGPLLEDRGFDAQKITITKFTEVKTLWLDKQQFNLVVFNLLSNAIKYAYDDPERFHINVYAEDVGREYVIHFCDYGIGVHPEMREAIFLEGVRAPQAEEHHVAGDGLGLWVARSVVKAHGGTLRVTSCSNPTTFTISLPRWLTNRKTEKGTQ